MSRRGIRQMVVVDRNEPSRVVGMLTAAGIGQLLRTPLAPSAHTARQETGTQTAVSALMGQSGQAAVPKRTRSSSETSERFDPLTDVSVGAAMSPVAGVTVRQTVALKDARARIEELGAMLVTNAHGNLVGIVTSLDIHGRLDEEVGTPLLVGDVAVRNVVTVRPTETLRAAARRMSRLNLRQLPVIDAHPPTPPIGVLRRSDVLAAYGRALAGGHAVAAQTLSDEPAQPGVLPHETPS
jgi:CBS domain-containing protein